MLDIPRSHIVAISFAVRTTGHLYWSAGTLCSKDGTDLVLVQAIGAPAGSREIGVRGEVVIGHRAPKVGRTPPAEIVNYTPYEVEK
jgi:hypothetical protein